MSPISLSRRLLFVSGFTLTAGAGIGIGLYVYSRPKYASLPSLHRPYTQDDLNALRFISKSKETSKPVTAEKNPGVRVFPGFLNDIDRDLLVKELKAIFWEYGINMITPTHQFVYEKQMAFLKAPPPVNMLRVTGRHEHAQQKRPEWSYGDEFNERNIPPCLAQLAEKIRSLPGIKLGKLRDITLNYRQSSFFRLDPHIDPALDGENVFIISVDSDAVLTLCPQPLYNLSQLWLGLKARVSMFFSKKDEWEMVRELKREEGIKSWTKEDIDVLVRQGDMVLLSGDARWNWTHGTRLGVEKEDSEETRKRIPKLWDWWGSPDNLIERGMERRSIVFAFEKGEEDKQKVN